MRAALALLAISAPGAALRMKPGCACLNWKDAYNDRGVQCGQGYELGRDHKQLFGGHDRMSGEVLEFGLESDIYKERCERFFKRLSFNKCLSTSWEFGSLGHWCYVSTWCEGVEKVKVPYAYAAIRMCTEEDGFLNVTDPEELNRLASVDSVDASLLGRVSYRWAAETWQEAQGSAGRGDGPEEAEDLELQQMMREEAAASLAAVRASGIPTLYKDDGDGGGQLVRGQELWSWVKDENKYRCVEGCQKS